MDGWAGVLNDLSTVDPSLMQGDSADMAQFAMVQGDEFGMGMNGQTNPLKRMRDETQDYMPGGERKRVVIPCRFFMRGMCTNGDGCRFSHDPAHIQAAQGQGTDMEAAEVLPDPNAKGYKTTLCRFFLGGGRCTRGELCSYAHGVEQLRGSMNEKNLQIMVDSQANNELHAQRKADRIANEGQGQSQIPRGLRGGVPSWSSGQATEGVGFSMGGMMHQEQVQHVQHVQQAPQETGVSQSDVMQAIATLQSAGLEVIAPQLTGVPHQAAIADANVTAPSSSGVLLKVYLDKSDGDRLGVNIDQAPGGILVTGCDQTGLVAVWNQYRPDEQIEAGDKIISVNGTSSSPQAMLSEIKKDQILLLTVEKGGSTSVAQAPQQEHQQANFAAPQQQQYAPQQQQYAQQQQQYAPQQQHQQTQGGAGNSSVPRSSLLCKFFELGRCTKGEECQFAHGRDQLDLSSVQVDTTRFKTKLCKFVAAGQFCARAENCPFAHSNEEIGNAGGMEGMAMQQMGGDANAFGGFG